jgi:hypothetical protein
MVLHLAPMFVFFPAHLVFVVALLATHFVFVVVLLMAPYAVVVSPIFFSLAVLAVLAVLAIMVLGANPWCASNAKKQGGNPDGGLHGELLGSGGQS